MVKSKNKTRCFIISAITLSILTSTSLTSTAKMVPITQKNENLVVEKKIILQDAEANLSTHQSINLVTNTQKAIYYDATGDFCWPVPQHTYITYGIGWRWGAYHKGIDISDGGIGGADIVAADGGTVVEAVDVCPHNYAKDGSCGCGGGYGNYVVIDHGNGYQTLYGHMLPGSVRVSVGEKVAKGYTVIGSVGTTGHSTGNHLHFEIKKDGSALDPQDFV